MNGKSRAWALALLVAVLLLGGLAGAAVDRMLVSDRPAASSQRGRSSDRDRRRSYLDWLAGKLDLSEAQRAEVQVILERHQEQISELWRDMRPQYEALQEQARAEIREVLNDEQRATYEALLERQRDRHRRDSEREPGNSTKDEEGAS